MEAQAWTAIGLLAATLMGVMFHLTSRIDALGSDLRAEMRAGFQGQGARIDGAYAHIDGMSGRIEALSERIDGLAAEVRTGFQAQGARIDALSGRLDALASETRAGFQAQGARIDALAERMEEQGTRLADRIYELAVKLDDHLRRHAS